MDGKIYLVQHLNTLPDGEESVKTIGIFRTRNAAVAAVESLAHQPGFQDHPRIVDGTTDDGDDGFHLSEYELDAIHWQDGFATVFPDGAGK